MERWDDLRIFLAAFREGSCAAAGARLGVNQSTISRRIGALERDLGVRLFDRIPEGLVPTAAAEEIVPRAELFEATAAELMDAVEGIDTRLAGVVRVALPEMIASELVAPALPSFMRERPGLRLELIAGDAIVDLSRREADLALRFVRPESGDLVVRRVATLRFGVFGSKEYLSKRRGRSTEELEWLDWDTTKAHLPDAAWLHAAFPRVEPVLRTSALGVRLRATCGGLGVSVLARPLAERYPELEAIEGLPPMPEIPVWLVGHRALRSLPRIKAVWALLEELTSEFP
ncbi:MAG: LysR family transcriptional regulator [Deltaproteobacteria bacterium]|nr:MAG: LysR family transcriptional regulator [Deltaproteobacteria bacterium]